MPETMQVDLVSPEQILYSGEASMVLARTTSGGDVAFMPGHAPFIAALDSWTVRVMLPGGGEETFAVYGGFVEVSNNRVSVLSDDAELPHQIDVAAARAAKEDAERRLRAGDPAAVADLRRAEVRLLAAGSVSGGAGIRAGGH